MKSSNRTVVYAIGIALIILVLSGCATQSLHQKKAKAFYLTGEYDKAVEYLEKAYKEKPKSDIKILLFRARLNSYYFHLARARKFKENDKKEDAIKEYNIALEIFPGNKKLAEEVETETPIPAVFLIFGLFPADIKTVGLLPPFTATGTLSATPSPNKAWPSFRTMPTS